MKQKIITLAIFISSALWGFSQDIITKTTGEDIQSKVLEITSSEVKYRKYDNLNGPIFTILKNEVLMVRYENGSKDIFNTEKKEAVKEIEKPAEDPFFQGQADATRYYDGYKGAATGTLVASLLSPLVGLIPAVACSSTPPTDENLHYPNAELMKNPNYYNGYVQNAKKIKRGKVWKNWGIAFGINIVAVIILSSGG